jgi:hypothetical protein
MKQAGIDMLAPEAGIPIIRRELLAGTGGELVIGQRLGILVKESDPEGGLETGSSAIEAALKQSGVMVGKVAGMGLHSGLMVETTLDPAKQPFLFDHQINLTPVLPGVMGIEAMAETAKLLFPDRFVGSIENVQFLTPFKFYRNQPRTLTVEATLCPAGVAIVAECRLVGRRQLPNQPEPQVTTHFTARVRLTKQPPASLIRAAVKVPDAPMIQASDIYRLYFHGPAYQVVQRAWREGNHVIGQLAANLPANHQPADRPLAMAPRLIELCFQTAGLWEMGMQSRMGLPQHVRDVRLLRAPELAQGALYAVVTPDPDGHFDAAVVDAAGSVFVQLSGYATVALLSGIDAERLKPLQRVIAGTTAAAAA